MRIGRAAMSRGFALDASAFVLGTVSVRCILMLIALSGGCKGNARAPSSVFLSDVEIKHSGEVITIQSDGSIQYLRNQVGTSTMVACSDTVQIRPDGSIINAKDSSDKISIDLSNLARTLDQAFLNQERGSLGLMSIGCSNCPPPESFFVTYRGKSFTLDVPTWGGGTDNSDDLLSLSRKLANATMLFAPSVSAQSNPEELIAALTSSHCVDAREAPYLIFAAGEKMYKPLIDTYKSLPNDVLRKRVGDAIARFDRYYVTDFLSRLLSAVQTEQESTIGELKGLLAKFGIEDHRIQSLIGACIHTPAGMSALQTRTQCQQISAALLRSAESDEASVLSDLAERLTAPSDSSTQTRWNYEISLQISTNNDLLESGRLSADDQQRVSAENASLKKQFEEEKSVFNNSWNASSSFQKLGAAIVGNPELRRMEDLMERVIKNVIRAMNEKLSPEEQKRLFSENANFHKEISENVQTVYPQGPPMSNAD